MLYKRAIKQGIPVSSAEMAEAARILENTHLRSYDCVLVSTNHAAYNWQLVADHSEAGRRHVMARPILSST